MLLALVVSILLLVTIASLLFAGVAVLGWRRERSRTQLLAERINVEGQIAALTAQTLSAMRQAARAGER